MPAGPTHEGGPYRPILALEAEEQCNSMWLSFDVCVRVCLRFVVPSVVTLSLALLEGRGLGERGIVRFRQQKIGIGMGYGIGKK